MVIPHDGVQSLNWRVPMFGLFASIALAMIGGVYVFRLAVKGLELKAQQTVMAEKVKFYSDQFHQWNATVKSLRNAEETFRQLFSLGSREQVLNKVEASSVGSLDIPELVSNLRKTIENVDEIKNYLSIQRNIYVATPKGYPASGHITSRYGKRTDPMNGDLAFHSGIDISSDSGMPVRSTADGVVSHSGWTQKSGYVVVLEHGRGFSTVYAHNKGNTVRVGQIVRRGDIIGYVGSTGKSTGPHVHYEVWKDGRAVDAQPYLSQGT
jgi:murein DD-endopeptidase MepM/ murein hydrolase activator NlpD